MGMEISNDKTSLLYTIQGAIGKEGGGLPLNSAFFVTQVVLDLVVLDSNRCFCQIMKLSGFFLPALSPCLSCLSLSSLNVDKLTFRSAAKNLTHGLGLLSLNLLTYNQQHYNPDEFMI